MKASRAWLIGAAAVTLSACTAVPAHRFTVALNSSCGDRAVQVIARNVDAISAHRYAQASATAETAARISLACAKKEPAAGAQRFNDTWRGANALVVAAELAHQAHDSGRARRLLSEGYGIMHRLRPPKRVNTLTWTLISQTRSGAERDLRGQWSYW